MRPSVSALDDHVGGLDDRGRGHAFLQAQLLDRVARDDRDEAHRARRRRARPAPSGRRPGRRSPCARKRLRAEMCVPWPSPRSRSSSCADTTRRLLRSRVTLIRPLRSQRRSVSRLIPSAAAASLAVYSCFGIASSRTRPGRRTPPRSAARARTPSRSTEPAAESGQRARVLRLVRGDLADRQPQRRVSARFSTAPRYAPTISRSSRPASFRIEARLRKLPFGYEKSMSSEVAGVCPAAVSSAARLA